MSNLEAAVLLSVWLALFNPVTVTVSPALPPEKLRLPVPAVTVTALLVASTSVILSAAAAPVAVRFACRPVMFSVPVVVLAMVSVLA